MQKYAKIVQDRIVSILSNNDGTEITAEQAKNFTDFVKMDVELAYNGNWYVKGFAPVEPLQEAKDKKTQEIKQELATLDAKYLTPRVLSEVPESTYAREQKDLHELEAIPLRAKLVQVAECTTLECVKGL